MKLYIIPTEKKCNGSCPYCITKARKTIKSDFLKPGKLKQILIGLENIDSIEITGGGEPSLNNQITEIVKIASNLAPTKLYTNGSIELDRDHLNLLDELCLSRAHWQKRKNQSIMAVNYNLNKLTSNLKSKLKLSLVLSLIGISNSKDLLKYLAWARSRGAYKVVVREIFPFQVGFNSSYKKLYSQLHYPINNLIKSINLKKINNSHPNLFFNYYGLEVEFEICGCSDNPNNRIIRSDGKIYSGWNNLKPIKE